MDILVIARLILVIIIVVIVTVLLRLNRSFKIDRRVSRYSIDSILDDNNSIVELIGKKYNHLLKRVRGKFKKVGLFDRESLKYNKYVNVGETKQLIDFIIIKLFLGICFVSLVIISFSIQGRVISFWGMVIGFIIGYYIYDIFLYYSSKSKKQKIKNDMLRAVIVMGNAFKAGKSVLQAVEIVSRDLPKPISTEFKRIYQDLVFGLSSEVAFSRFAKRVDLDEARYLSSSLTILSRTGGNIVDVFDSIERTLFDKKKLEEDLKNSTQASSMIIKILMAAPIVFIVIIYSLSPNYFDPLFESSFGYILMFIMWVMFVLYVYFLNKVTKVKV